MMNLSEAVAILTTTYQSLDSVAVGLPVDPKEVADALLKVDSDTAEAVALNVLAKYNPVVEEKTLTKSEKIVKENVDTNSKQ